MQKARDGSWRLVQCGSISLKEAERRYSVIDTELLALTYGILKCSYYLKGCKFVANVDHRPLVGLSRKGWDEITPRQARLFEKIQGYSYTVCYLQGKYMYLPDFLSRSPIWRGTEEQRLRAVMDNGAACARRARAVAPLADDGRFKSLLAAASGDHAYQALVKAVADRTRSADLGAYAKEIDNMELVGEAGSD